MNILFDSRKREYKSVFGPLRTGEACRFAIDIPTNCGAYEVRLMAEGLGLRLEKEHSGEGYDRFAGVLCPQAPGLFFYRFAIRDQNGDYELFKAGDGTNIGLGELWQLSVLPVDYAPPEDFRGAVYYQIFPDRFFKSGDCDLREKIGPYTLGDFESFSPKAPDATDFAGGNLRGIRAKLDYIQSLGTEVIYLNPIFMAWSNHRYDTADYKRIDPLLGSEEDFRLLCAEAHERGMKILLDGVFSHTGSISRYFDADGRFGGGACSLGTESPYYEWYDFEEFPKKYACWWGIEVLPNVFETRESYMDFILRDEDSVVAKWLRLGADGWRLDVADELPDAFIAALYRRVKELKPSACVIGEVWEDASNKEAYGVRRQYFTAPELDGVINYPFRKAVLDFAAGGDGGEALGAVLGQLSENYPAAALDCSMSVLGTHDTERLATVLPDKARRKLAIFLQFMLPGAPVIYYGDEAGLAGGRDPQNRRCFPWGREDEELTDFYRQMAALKRAHPALRRGGVELRAAGDGVIAFVRRLGAEALVIRADRSSGELSVCRENGEEVYKMVTL